MWWNHNSRICTTLRRWAPWSRGTTTWCWSIRSLRPLAKEQLVISYPVVGKAMGIYVPRKIGSQLELQSEFTNHMTVGKPMKYCFLCKTSLRPIPGIWPSCQVIFLPAATRLSRGFSNLYMLVGLLSRAIFMFHSYTGRWPPLDYFLQEGLSSQNFSLNWRKNLLESPMFWLVNSIQQPQLSFLAFSLPSGNLT
jgi:hypothetical protein